MLYTYPFGGVGSYILLSRWFHTTACPPFGFSPTKIPEYLFKYCWNLTSNLVSVSISCQSASIPTGAIRGKYSINTNAFPRLKKQSTISCIWNDRILCIGFSADGHQISFPVCPISALNSSGWTSSSIAAAVKMQ